VIGGARVCASEGLGVTGNGDLLGFFGPLLSGKSEA